MGSSYIAKDICFYSFNSRGFDEDKQDICRLLTLKNDSNIPILCNQENFLLRNNSYKVRQCLADSHIYFKEAVMESSYGRPKNGMFIAVPKEIKENVTDVSPDHWRTQAILVSTVNCNILVINSYFPTDPKTLDFDAVDLLSTLATIKDVLNSNNFDHIIWAGDLNADFGRNTNFTQLIDQFITEMNLLKSWDKYHIDFTHTTENNGKTFLSTLDHFCWTADIESNIIDAGVLYIPQNMSDHSPIFCVLKIHGLLARIQITLDGPSKLCWKKASPEQRDKYRASLENKLNLLNTKDCCDECLNVHCDNSAHKEACDDALSNLLKCVENAANEFIPCSGRGSHHKKKKTVLAMWNDELKPFKDKAMFWHAIWISAGKPINTELHRIMKRARNVYHFQIRKSKKVTNILKKNTLLQACIDNRDVDLFREIRKLRCSAPIIANKIDGKYENIPNHFAGIYSKLYNSVNDKGDLIDVQNMLNKNIDSNSVDEVHKITPIIVADAVNHLKDGKADPIYDFSSDCLKNAPFIFYEQLASLFRKFLIHGHISSVLLLATLVPILKDKLGDICGSDNYRSIAISSLILKVFDWTIISLYGDKLNFDQLQFGYQPKISTNMCTWMAIETIDYFTRNGSDVFVCAMDMSKAFDRVKHSLLFRKLVEMGLPEIYIRLLFVIYREQTANVRWNNEISDTLSLSNGVKQGAVLSAILFCVYINDLFDLLRKRRSGCWVNDEFNGIVGYSDDLLLLSPSLDALQDMLLTCEKYAMEHNLQFSTNFIPSKSKTKCMAYVKKKRELKNIVLCGNKLPWVDNIKHLGSVISNDLDTMKNDTLQKRAAYINRNNEILQEFHYAHPISKVKINNSFNTSFYGCVLWDMFSKELRRLDKTWNVSMRKMLHLPRNTHRYFLEPISKTNHITTSLYSRFIKFIDTVKSCNKSAMRNLFECIKLDCRSKTGSNLRNIMLKLGKNQVDEINLKDIKNIVYQHIPRDSEWKIEFVKELIDHQLGKTVIPGFESNEIDDTLNYVCTS